MQGDRELQEPQGGGLGSRGQRQPGKEGATCCPWTSSRALLSQPEAGANAIPKGCPPALIEMQVQLVTVTRWG